MHARSINLQLYTLRLLFAHCCLSHLLCHLSANCGHYPLRLSINGEQVTYATDIREDILRAADIFLENGIHTETGPHKHAIQGTFFLYVGSQRGIVSSWQTLVHG